MGLRISTKRVKFGQVIHLDKLIKDSVWSNNLTIHFNQPTKTTTALTILKKQDKICKFRKCRCMKDLIASKTRLAKSFRQENQLSSNSNKTSFINNNSKDKYKDKVNKEFINNNSNLTRITKITKITIINSFRIMKMRQRKMMALVILETSMMNQKFRSPLRRKKLLLVKSQRLMVCQCYQT